MNEERKQEINQIVEGLHKKYYNSNEIDWNSISKDFDICWMDSPRFFVPMALKIAEQYFVVTSPLVKSFGGIDYTAHEFGHILLGHLDKKSESYAFSENEKGSEANYFARSLVGEVEDEKVPFWKEWYAEIRYREAANISSSGSEVLWQHYLVSYIKKQAEKELSRREKLRNRKRFSKAR